MTTESSSQLLIFFQDFLESNKLEHLKYVTLDEVRERHGILVDSIDIEKGLIRYWDVFSDQHSNGEPTEAIVTYNFYNDHKKKLLLKAKNVTTEIDKLVYAKTGANETYRPILKNISHELYYLKRRANRLYPQYMELTKALKFIEDYLHNRYEIKPFAQKKANQKLSFFGFKNTISRDTFIEIYDLADRLEIIDYDEVDEQTFLEVFLENPSDPNKIIKFNCRNDLLKQFIEQLRPYFTSLNPKTIEKSGKFFSKGGTPISESNYNRTKIQSNIKLDRLISEMDYILKK